MLLHRGVPLAAAIQLSFARVMAEVFPAIGDELFFASLFMFTPNGLAAGITYSLALVLL